MNSGMTAVAEGQFEEMVRFNFSQETGRDWPVGAESFRTNYPVIADGRMAPHEWIRSQDGRLIKVDASQHGDDHFFPGPDGHSLGFGRRNRRVEYGRRCGAVSAQSISREEWNYPQQNTMFSLAYSMFRASYCKMALMGTGVESEKPRLERAYRFYREKIDDSVRQLETARSDMSACPARPLKSPPCPPSRRTGMRNSFMRPFGDWCSSIFSSSLRQ